MQKRLKKREACKGGKRHEYIWVLPPHVKINARTTQPVDLIAQYYNLQEKHRLQCVEQDKELEALGVVLGYTSNQIQTQVHMRCIQCGKKDTRPF